MPFNIVRQDITKMKVDAIVNAANVDLQMGGGVCGAIFKKAGIEMLKQACDMLAPIQSGQAVITPAFNLPSKWIIHTAGPIYAQHVPSESETLLRSCYRNALTLAVNSKCKSIAFPLISSGTYGYPKHESLRIAREEIQSFLLNHEVGVSLVVFDKETLSISESVLGEIQAYIDDHYVEEHFEARSTFSSSFAPFRGAKKKKERIEESTLFQSVRVESAGLSKEDNLQDVLAKLDEPFSDTLLRLIDSKGMSDVEVYKKANIDRKLFSKIRSLNGYVPTKRTILALAIAMQLSLEETNALLKCAGYALSHSVRFDLIVEHYIQKKSYDLYEINEVLFYYDQPLLGVEK